MPVETLHPKYSASKRKWRRCRVVTEGEDAVKDAGEEFLPRLSGQSDQEYAAYKARATFFAGTSRTLQALIGMVFRNPPVVKFPDLSTFPSFLAEITRDRRSLESFAKEAIGEVFALGRFGILVDMFDEGTAPYLAGYSAESIRNWRTQVVNGREEYDLVVLEEPHAEPEDEFDTKQSCRLRVLQIVDGVYQQSIYHKRSTRDKTTGSEWVLAETLVPLVRGQPWPFIPFVVCGVHNLASCPETPPLHDMAVVNLSHYRTSADLEHGRHYTALPTPWAAGFDTKRELYLGSSVAWISDEPNARCGFLEFTGQGLSALENAAKEKQQHMAILGARLLDSEKMAAEAAETLKIRRSSETNVVASAADTVGEALETVLEWCALWLGAPVEGIEVELNKEFLDLDISEGLMRALMEAVQAGMVSWDTYFFNLKRGQIIPPQVEMDVERELIAQGGPMSPLTAVNFQNQQLNLALTAAAAEGGAPEGE